MFDISMGAAFSAGLLSFLSPCVLPLVPPYLCYLSGVSLNTLLSEGEHKTPGALRRTIFFRAIAFVLGFSTVFVALGATASLLGQFILSNFRILSVFAGVIVIVAGLYFLGLFRFALLAREARIDAWKVSPGFFGAYMIGLAFAFGWTPCIGPTLAAILFMASADGTVSNGVLLLSLYSLGLGVPFLITAGFSSVAVGRLVRLKKYLGIFEKTMGVLLVVVGILMITGDFSRMSYLLLEWFPALGDLG